MRAIDAVAFTARCPACGRDADWVEERLDTTVRIAITCACRRRKAAA